MYRRNLISNLTGLGGLIISALLIINFSTLVPILADFSEKNFSPDQHLGPGGIYNVKMVFFTSIFLLIILSSLCIVNLNITGKINVFLNTYIDLESAKNLFFQDDLCSKKHLSRNIFIAATSLGILAHLYVLTFGDPTWEGVMEEFFSLIFLYAAILLTISSFTFKKNRFSPQIRNRIFFTLIGIAIILVFIYGEEISWGQRIFGLDSPEFFDEYNTQTETNLHNFFNPLFLFVYPIFGIGLFISLFFLWFFPSKKKKKSYLYNLFIPHPSLFYLVFVMACTSFLGETEIFEETLAIFVFLYSIRIFMSLRYPSTEINLTKEYS